MNSETYKQSELLVVMAYLLYNGCASFIRLLAIKRSENDKSKLIKDPKPCDLFMISLKQPWKVVKERTRDRCKALGWIVNSGEIPIEQGDSWFSAKTI